LAPPASTVGAFERALYRPRHVYRPSAECRMRTLSDPFCAVCAASIRVKLSGFDRPVAGPRTYDRITVNAMPDLTPDDVPAAIDNRAVVTLEGYVVDTLDDDEIAVITDPWMRDRLIIARDQVVHRIPGADRSSSGESVLWVLRDAPMRRIVTGTAEQFGSGGAGGGTGEAGSGWSPPPPPYPRR
jgi:hypothetical protein